MMLSFTKMQGLGNDFIFVAQEKNPTLARGWLPELARILSRRRFSVGADGLVYLSYCAEADLAMDIYNADGSVAQICGNALRCAGIYQRTHALCKAPCITVQTEAGLRRVYPGDAKTVTVDMALASFFPPDIPLVQGTPAVFDGSYLGVRLRVHAVNVGNPHAVVFTQHADSADLAALGKEISVDRRFLYGANVEFVQCISDKMLRVRVFERGCGITLGCGSGACAAVAAAVKYRGYFPGKPITVRLDGGDAAVLYATDGRLFLTGDAQCVYDGEIAFDPTLSHMV